MEPTAKTTSSGWNGKKIAQAGIPVLVILLIAGVALAARGGGDDGDEAATTRESGSADELILSGPMTPQKAELEGVEVDFGPSCDPETGRLAIPTNGAPPCVEPFEGDNGGATSPGVTADAITVVAYEIDPALDPQGAALTGDAGVDIAPDAAFQTTEDWVELYSEFFELYGRAITLERYVGRGAPDDAEQAKADDIDIQERFDPFAVVGGPGQTQAFADELAAREILCIATCAGGPDQEDMDDQAPYLWPLGPSAEQFATMTAELVGKGLAGGKATFAGEDLQDTDRVFGGLYYQVSGEDAPAFDTFTDQLATFDVELAAAVPYELDLPRVQEIARTSITKLKEAGVTSVVLAADPFSVLFFAQEATAQDWFPEWIIGPNVNIDLNLVGRQYPQDQWAHAFGLKVLPVPLTDAASEPFDLYEWYFGGEAPINTYGSIGLNLSPLFNGIHLAGPDLTPDTFADGLFRVPLGEGTPLSPISARGRDGLWPVYGEDYVDYYGVDDLALIWWDPDTETEDELDNVGAGVYQFAHEGERYLQTELPEDLGLFDPDTSVAIFDEVPEDLAAPTYPAPR